jgi:hypothetical protein
MLSQNYDIHKITEFNENESPEKPNSPGLSSPPTPYCNGKLGSVVGIESVEVRAAPRTKPLTPFEAIGKENSVVPSFQECAEESYEDREEIPEEYPEGDIG